MCQGGTTLSGGVLATRRNRRFCCLAQRFLRMKPCFGSQFDSGVEKITLTPRGRVANNHGDRRLFVQVARPASQFWVLSRHCRVRRVAGAFASLGGGRLRSDANNDIVTWVRLPGIGVGSRSACSYCRLLVAIVIDDNLCHNANSEPQEFCESYAGKGEQYVSTR